MKPPPKSPCPCGSGLRALRCCKLDLATAAPTDPALRPQVERAAAAHDLGQVADATRLCLEVLERSPLQPGALAILLATRKSEGNAGAAEALARRLVALDPNNLSATSELALLLFNRGDLARAETLLAQAETIAPSHPTVLLFRAITHGRTRDYDQALATLERITAQRQDGALGPSELIEKGLLLDRMGRFPEAFAAFDAGKQALRAATGQAYLADDAATLAVRLK